MAGLKCPPKASLSWLVGYKNQESTLAILFKAKAISISQQLVSKIPQGLNLSRLTLHFSELYFWTVVLTITAERTVKVYFC